MTVLKQTALFDFHAHHGARMVEFAGWSMPIQYAHGIIKEHQACRTRAALFDVSHMVQVEISGRNVAVHLERLVVGDLQALRSNCTRYTLITNDKGGVLDDLMATRLENDLFFLVLNAARREHDIEHLKKNLPSECTIRSLDDRALLALQGPDAETILASHVPGADRLSFLESGIFAIDGDEVRISRVGYTGEDGFEVSVPNARAIQFAEMLLAHPAVDLAGLGARDTLRLEAGLCLYGHELDENTTPVEANLSWTIGKRRRTEGGFLGDHKILKQLQEKPGRLLVGLEPEGRTVPRAGAEIRTMDENKIGTVTSGGFGPSVERPIALGYIPFDQSAEGTSLLIHLRNRDIATRVRKPPFWPHRFKRK